MILKRKEKKTMQARNEKTTQTHKDDPQTACI